MANGKGSIGEGEIFELLSHSYRRQILRYLRKHGTATKDELIRDIGD